MARASSKKEEYLLRKTCKEVGVTYIPLPTHRCTITSAENQRRLDSMHRKIAYKRAKELSKARIIGRLNQSSYGQELLLGRNIFKKLIQGGKQVSKNISSSSSAFITSYKKKEQDEVNGNNDRSRHAILLKSFLEYRALQKYLEHRTLRHLRRRIRRQGINVAPLQKDLNKDTGLIVSQDFISQQSIMNEIVSSSSLQTILPKNHPLLDENISNNESSMVVVPDKNLSMMVVVSRKKKSQPPKNCKYNIFCSLPNKILYIYFKTRTVSEVKR